MALSDRDCRHGGQIGKCTDCDLDHMEMAADAEARRVDELTALRKQDTELIRQLVEALEVTASDVCQVAHHKKRDQHGNGDVCPVQARHDEAITAGRARLESKL